MKAVIVLLIVCVLVPAPLSAQDSALPEADRPGWDVFIKRHDDGAATELVFINILTGEMNSVDTAGERFTMLGNGVIYYDLEEDQVKLATPDSSPRDHPFVTRSADTYRVDWVVTSDGQTIAWTATRRVDEGALLTATFVSDSSGANMRDVLADGPRKAVRVLPVAFSAATNELIMEAHPDGISQHYPYTQYAGLFAVDLVDGSVRRLPYESGCYCAAGFGDQVYLRFPPNLERDGVDVMIVSLDGSQQTAIANVVPAGFTTTGGALVSADNALALYAVSQLPGHGEAAGEIRSVFVLADLVALEQSLVSNPITGLVHTVKWTEDEGAVLFTSDQQMGTWKLRLSDGKITEVATALYLGSLRD